MKTNNDFKSFFPVDESSKTNIHYDLVASKFMTGIENHKRTQYNNSASNNAIFPLIGAIIQIVLGLLVFIIASVFHLFKSSKQP
jgi:hypothetical protein